MKLITHSKPWIDEADLDAVRQALSSGMISRGRKAQDFEDAVAEYSGASGCVAVGSATAALILILKALDIGPGDEVILPTYVCVSVANAVKAVGAKPVLCDIGGHWNMTPQTVEPHVSKNTKAIIVVHIFGITADTASFKRFNVPIIEDCAQAFGARTSGKIAGTAGKAAIFSFNAIKCLTTGEGGIAASMDVALVDRMRELRSCNAVASPMTDIQGALGLSQLSRYDEMLTRRRSIADKYFGILPHHLVDKVSAVKKASIFFRFPITIPDDFETLRRSFEASGIAVRKGVDALIHRQFGLSDAGFPNAVKLFNTTLSLPIYPALEAKELDIILHEAARLWKK